jgi:exosome complex RNA-binding protein Rrp42 (RNase PH superfamily)
MNGNAIFSDLLYLLNLVIRNNIVIYVFADVLLLKKDSEESIASFFSQKKWYFRHE